MARKGQNKTFANKRTMNPTGAPRKKGEVSSSRAQDPKRRLGDYVAAGEHARNTVRSTEKK